MSRGLLFILLQCLFCPRIFGGILTDDASSTIYDCNCDVQIDVVRNFMHEMAATRQMENKISTEISHLKTQLTKISNEKLMPTSCVEAAAGSFKSGVYKILLERFNVTPFEVFCNEDVDFGGWLVIQRRINDAVDFYRDWQAYKEGFGDLTENYWLGLEKLHVLTSSCEQELYIEMERFSGKKYYAKYTEFIIGSETEGYVLKNLGNYIGNAGDSLTQHIDMKFSTHDRDNDKLKNYNCAIEHKGAWWFEECYHSHLNAQYESERYGINWNDISIGENLKSVQMMIRPTERCWKRLSLRK